MITSVAVSAEMIMELIPPLQPQEHKGTRGHALLVGGSKGKIGAISLSAAASLQVGCGLTTVFLPECGYSIIQTSHPEVMAMTDRDENVITDIAVPFSPDAVGIGPGMGQDSRTASALREFLKSITKPVVIDADGLNLLAANPTIWDYVPIGSVLTPHPGEFARLSQSVDNNRMPHSALAFAKERKVILVLKGAPSLITDGDRIFRNTTGNPALATGGSGDVLTGMITGLMAQGLSPLDAALAGVYVHGLTADLALEDMSARAFIASDILHYLGLALKQLQR